MWDDARFDFAGKTVLVTGGSNGIGRGIAQAFHEAGATVLITGTREREAYDDPFEGLTFRRLEMRDHSAIAALGREIGRLDILVNNAGTARAGQTSEHEAEGFEATIAVNLLGSFRMAHAVRAQLEAARGSVLNLASMYAIFGSPQVPGYSASKGGIVQLTKSLAVAWAKIPIRVNAIAPGWIESNLTRGAVDDPARGGPIMDRTPLGYWGSPRDVAGAALFLSSSAASYITGVTLPVDGGYSVK